MWDEFFLKTLTWGAIQRGCKVLRVVHSFLFYSIFTDFSLFILIWLLFVVATICVSHVWTMEFPVFVCQNGYKDQRTFRRWFMMIPSHLCCPLLWSHMKGWTASNMHDCPPLVIILCLIRLSWSSESWFKDFFFWGTSALFLIYDRYIWKGRIIFPSFLFSTTVNFLEDAHLQGWLWVFVKRYHPKSWIHWKKEAVYCTITFCILQCFVVVDIFGVGWTDSRCRLVWTSIYIDEKMIVLQYVFYKLLLDQINFNKKGITLLK